MFENLNISISNILFFDIMVYIILAAGIDLLYPIRKLAVFPYPEVNAQWGEY